MSSAWIFHPAPHCLRLPENISASPGSGGRWGSAGGPHGAVPNRKSPYVASIPGAWGDSLWKRPNGLPWRAQPKGQASSNHTSQGCLTSLEAWEGGALFTLPTATLQSTGISWRGACMCIWSPSLWGLPLRDAP